MAKGLIGIDDFQMIEVFAEQGKANNVNILVEDIVGTEIGIASSKSTASNFGKLVSNSKNADIAAGIFALVGESIAMLTGLACKDRQLSTIYFAGTAANSIILQQIIIRSLKRYQVSAIFHDDPAFSTVNGAICLYKEENG